VGHVNGREGLFAERSEMIGKFNFFVKNSLVEIILDENLL
jgi:hypothetical protein